MREEHGGFLSVRKSVCIGSTESTVPLHSEMLNDTHPSSAEGQGGGGRHHRGAGERGGAFVPLPYYHLRCERLVRLRAT